MHKHIVSISLTVQYSIFDANDMHKIEMTEKIESGDGSGESARALRKNGIGKC